MGKLERVVVDLPEEVVADLHAAVDGGEFASISEAIASVLRDRGQPKLPSPRNLQELNELVEEARKGPFVDGPTFMAQLRADTLAKVRGRE